MSIKLSKRDNLVYLTVSMLVLLLLIAVAEEIAAAWGQGTVQLGFLSVLVVALWTARGSRGLYRSGLGVLGVLVLLTVVSYWISNTGLRLAQLTALTALLCGIVWFAFMGCCCGDR